MAGSNRKSVGFVGIDASETSPSVSNSRRRRSIAAQKVIESNIEENDDEAEKLARRERNENGSPSSNFIQGSDRRQSFGLSPISNLTASEMNNQIAQCIKLSTENKINDKNAFQLKMIDFLVYALKKQDPNMTNLQMASASLDASAKIYGFRVDKVHSDLLKILGMAKQDQKDHDQNDNPDNEDPSENNKNEPQQKKKKKKNRQNIISTVEALRGAVETYDPLSLIRCQRDTQTSDMLFQAGLPQHSKEDVTLNLYNDVLLDTVVASKNKSNNYSTLVTDDFENHAICPSYAAFKFNDWSPDNEIEEAKDQEEENNGEFHFDLDAAVPDEDVEDFDAMQDCGDVFEERCDKLTQRHNVENIVDFQDIITNNINPNATYEYSYLQKSCRIQWAGPSHWKITLNRNLGNSRVVESCKQNAKKTKKEIEIILTEDSKEDAKMKFTLLNRQTKLLSKTTKFIWSEDKVTFPEDKHHNIKHYYSFFNKPTEYLKFHDERNMDSQVNNNFDVADEDHDNQEHVSFGDHFGDNFENDDDRLTHDFNTQDNTNFAITQSQGAFMGDNLVSAPKLTDKIFIPYSQRAKKIDMRQLKKVMWKNLKDSSRENEKENFDITEAIENENSTKIKPKVFSSMYLEIPKRLSKLNAESLSPAIAFVSLLHLANEKNFKIDREPELSDLHMKDTTIEA